MSRRNTTRGADRPRSLVTHLVHLSGADPIDARFFANSSGRAAIKRLKITPALKARTKTTVLGRHTIALVTDKTTGEVVRKNVRRKKSVPVHRWTLTQAARIVADMKPRKTEYKEIREAALCAVAAITVEKAHPLRRLPRHRTWSKRR